MTIIRVADWTPDAADLGNPGSILAKNVLPGANSYKPFPSLSVLTNALTARPRGAIEARDKDGNIHQYVGDASDIYSLSGTTWSTVSLITVSSAAVADGGSGYTVGDDLTVSGGTGTAATLNVDSVSGGVITAVSVLTEGAYSAAPSNPVSVTGGTGTGATFNLTTATYSTSSDERWEFVQWQNKVLATNWDDEPQQITLGGAGFTNLTTALRARHIAVVRDFVVFGNTFDSSDGNVPDRVRWSASGDETDYTVSSSTLSDFRNLRTGDKIQSIVGGEFGIIVTEKSTWRMVFVGSPTVFQIDEVLPGNGTSAPGSVVKLGDAVYFLSPRGFVEISSGSSVRWLGAGKVDKFVIDDLDEDHLHRISAVADPKGMRVAWAYPGAGNVDGRPNKIVVYDRAFDKWSIIEDEVELIWFAGAIGRTLDNLDSVSSSIDDLEVSLDSSQWKGGAPQFGAFDENFKHGFFNGPPMTATVDTRETEIHAGHRTMLNAFRPLVDGATVTAQVGTRDRQSDTVSFGSSLTQSASGRFTTRSNARYHRFRLNITGSTWTDVIGVSVEPFEARKAERR